jgi:hypothetical protein
VLRFARGCTKYPIGNAEYLPIAEEIGQAVNAEVLRLKASETDVQ